jgi:hypothetical protein
MGDLDIAEQTEATDGNVAPNRRSIRSELHEPGRQGQDLQPVEGLKRLRACLAGLDTGILVSDVRSE